ncbi:MAG: GntR family transcriptional regulator [Thermodesulfobacteriota bacterium]|nr:GntR family transcriptional regulator [Thermodesulfobacteriota bacterium]
MIKEQIFHPVQVGRAGEDIALQIEAAILSNKIVVGERLPSERELQNQFKTGRGVIREAIKALKQKGLIEIRKGAKGGAYVKQVEVTNVSESLALFLKQHQIDPQHISEFRESLDCMITTLAIAHADVASKQELLGKTIRLNEMLVHAENNDDSSNMEVLGELDRELNIMLAQMTGNPVFEWIMRAMQLGFSSYDYTLYENPEFRRATAANWLETAQQIAAGEPLRALASIGAHYTMLNKCIDQSNL